MKNRVFLIALFYFSATISYALTLDEALTNQIAVEKVTGRAKSYEIGFSGWVGSLKFDINNKQIYIAEITSLESKVSIVVYVYKITKFKRFKNSIDFECEEIDFRGLWKGKIWLMDDGLSPAIEMQQYDSPRKWQNLGKYGRTFLKENKLEKLFLGM